MIVTVYKRHESCSRSYLNVNIIVLSLNFLFWSISLISIVWFIKITYYCKASETVQSRHEWVIPAQDKVHSSRFHHLFLFTVHVSSEELSWNLPTMYRSHFLRSRSYLRANSSAFLFLYIYLLYPLNDFHVKFSSFMIQVCLHVMSQSFLLKNQDH